MAAKKAPADSGSVQGAAKHTNLRRVIIKSLKKRIADAKWSMANLPLSRKLKEQKTGQIEALESVLNEVREMN